VDLTNEFRVPLTVEDAWAVLTDVERIAPCMPGTTLESVEGDDYKGTVKVKVGPMTAQYRGTARFLERDEAGRRAVLKAEGRETRGQGNASATITATITPDGDGSAVTVVTDLTITGKVAQFGRGVLADVSAKLMGQFVDCLEKDLGAQAAAMPPRPAPAAEPVNLVTTAGAPVAKRAAPLVAVVFLTYWLLRRRRRRKRAAA
jgi:carbon monoxide dehydrogenase subunit G